MHTDGILSIWECTHTHVHTACQPFLKTWRNFHLHRKFKSTLWSSLSDVGRNIYFPNYVFHKIFAFSRHITNKTVKHAQQQQRQIQNLKLTLNSRMAGEKLMSLLYLYPKLK